MARERKAAIVTGAATGIGAATSRWLATRGYGVVVNYHRSAEAAATVAAACGDAISVRGDVARDEDCRAIAGAALDRWGRIDALVNCAGTTQFVPMSELERLNAPDFERVFAVNVIGPYQMTRAAAAALKEVLGVVVNVSSVSGLVGSGSSYAYAASKGALNTLTLSLARNLAPEVRVNAVLPGFVEGRWIREGVGEAAYERVKEQWAERAALGRVCTPEEVADAIGWLITGAPVVTGQLIMVDAGIALGRPPAVAR
jgi:3-oxoacyl-[acyl-carrier protein] reductase